jgi:thiosulfate/3-mercaptopyruvate sulfurtransferase
MKASGATRSLLLAASLLLIGVCTRLALGVSPSPLPVPEQGSGPGAESIPAADLIGTDELAKIVQSSTAPHPLLFYVGFRPLFVQAHIPGSEYYGPASNPAVMEQLRKRLEKVPRNKFIVLYCGCCPWNHCPNVKPAYEAVRGMGFTKFKVLYVPSNLGTDWANKGFPLERGE